MAEIDGLKEELQRYTDVAQAHYTGRKPLTKEEIQGIEYHQYDLMRTIIQQLEAKNARLRNALKPFALTDDESLELGTFLDDEDVFLRPDDGNDSVKNGWRKQVTVGDLREARQALSVLS